MLLGQAIAAMRREGTGSHRVHCVKGTRRPSSRRKMQSVITALGSRREFEIRSPMALQHPVTPDGRYFVVKGRLWRLSNPALSEDQKSILVTDLMRARRAVKSAKQAEDAAAEAAAHHEVDKVKRALGERGPVWWSENEPDLNRHLVENTPYAGWFAQVKGRRTKRSA
jgi:hypothetical protein